MSYRLVVVLHRSLLAQNRLIELGRRPERQWAAISSAASAASAVFMLVISDDRMEAKVRQSSRRRPGGTLRPAAPLRVERTEVVWEQRTRRKELGHRATGCQLSRQRGHECRITIP